MVDSVKEEAMYDIESDMCSVLPVDKINDSNSFGAGFFKSVILRRSSDAGEVTEPGLV